MDINKTLLRYMPIAVTYHLLLFLLMLGARCDHCLCCCCLQKVSQDPYDIRKSHLSPPVSTRGLSDSDMSELDFDDGIGVVSGQCQLC